MGFEGFIALNTFYLVPATALTSAVFLVSRYGFGIRHWYWWEAVVLLVPGFVYCFLDLGLNLGVGKSFANLCEPILIGIGCGVIFAMRVYLGARLPVWSTWFAAVVPIVGLVLTLLVFFAMPPLPE